MTGVTKGIVQVAVLYGGQRKTSLNIVATSNHDLKSDLTYLKRKTFGFWLKTAEKICREGVAN